MNPTDIFLIATAVSILVVGYLISPGFFYLLGMADNYFQNRYMEKLQKSLIEKKNAA
jgi:hypothetical protein